MDSIRAAPSALILLPNVESSSPDLMAHDMTKPVSCAGEAAFGSVTQVCTSEPSDIPSCTRAHLRAIVHSELCTVSIGVVVNLPLRSAMKERKNRKVAQLPVQEQLCGAHGDEVKCPPGSLPIAAVGGKH